MRFRVELSVFCISVFQKTNFLSQEAVDWLDTAFAFTVINTNLNVNYLFWEIQYFRNLCLNREINNWLQTAKASLIFHFALKLKVLMSQPFYTLTLYILNFLLALLFIMLSFLLFYIWNSLTLKKCLFLILTHMLHLFIIFRITHGLRHSERFYILDFDSYFLTHIFMFHIQRRHTIQI